MTDTAPVSVLTTDLDGTFIPLADNQENRRDLVQLGALLQETSMQLVYVTGRHLASIQDAMATESLPRPQWIVSDVGTTLYKLQTNGDVAVCDAYAELLSGIIADFPIDRLSDQLSRLDGLSLQEPEKQGRFKLSFYCDASRIDQHSMQVRQQLDQNRCPYQLIASVDPFNGDGLLDLLPAGVSKAYAIDWWHRNQGLASERIMFAGDSGNDYAALTAGYRSIVVSNAAVDVVDRVKAAHAKCGWTNRLFLATKPATSGVLEGVRHFLSAAT